MFFWGYQFKWFDPDILSYLGGIKVNGLIHIWRVIVGLKNVKHHTADQEQNIPVEELQHYLVISA